jgi:hypothetical protein
LGVATAKDDRHGDQSLRGKAPPPIGTLGRGSKPAVMCAAEFKHQAIRGLFVPELFKRNAPRGVTLRNFGGRVIRRGVNSRMWGSDFLQRRPRLPLLPGYLELGLGRFKRRHVI